MYDSSYPLIFVTCDEEYINFLIPFLHFLDSNTKHKQVFVHFINTSNDTITEIIHKFPFIRDHISEKITLNNKNVLWVGKKDIK